MENNMDIKVIYKLSNIISEFNGMKLRNQTLLNKKLGGKDCLVLSMEFVDDFDEPKIMLLILDKEITSSENEKMYFDLVENNE